MKNALFFILLTLTFSCSQGERQTEVKRWMEPNGKVKILSTTAMIDDLVRGVGGDNVDAHTLIIGELNPHSYQLVKGDDEKLMNADIIFFNGLNLEHGPSLKKTLYSKNNAFGLGDLIQNEHPGKIISVNKEVDPHIWMDVSLFSEAIKHIVRILSEKDPKNASIYQQKGFSLEKELKDNHDLIAKLLKEVPDNKRYLVTSHDAFNYFAKAYLAEDREKNDDTWRTRVQAPEGLAPDSQLSALDIKAVINHMHKFQIDVLFPETNVSQDSIRKIVDASKEKGLSLKIATCPLYADAMGPKGSEGESYEKMMLHNAKTISRYLLGKGFSGKEECNIR